MKTDWTRILASALAAISLGAQSQDGTKPEGTPPPPAPPAEQPAPPPETNETPAPPEKDEMTQGEFAIKLAYQLGLFPVTSVTPSSQEAAAALSLQGITPFAGWQLDTVLDRGDFARMIIQAMGKAGEIPAADADNKQAWIDLANKLGIDMGVEESLEEVVPLTGEVAGGTRNPHGASSNPQDRAGVLGEPGERFAGGAISAQTVAKVLSMMKPPAPKPPTSPNG